MKKIFALALTASILSGCVSVGRKIDQTNADKIKKGETTRDEVLNLIGSPDQLTRDASGNVTFLYTFTRATAKPESYIPIVGAFAGGANVQQQIVMVVFGPDDIVTDMINTQGATESGVGANAESKADLPDVEQNKRGGDNISPPSTAPSAGRSGKNTRLDQP